MAEANKVLQGSLKYRDGKKWKQRWCVLQKLSPVADCLHVLFYKEYTECYKGSSKLSIPLLDFYGLDDSCQLEKENHVLAIVCKNRVVILAFDNQETLKWWKITIHQHLGEGRRFQAHLLKAPSFTKFSPGPVNAFIHQLSLCLSTSGCFGNALPRYLASWKICDLKRFGILDDKFGFEVEEKNGCGVYCLSLVEMREFDYLLRHIAQGNFDATNNSIIPSRPVTGTAAETTMKPRMISPVYKSLSLRHTVNPRVDYVDNFSSGSVVMSAPLHRHKMSEPYELAVADDDTVNAGNRHPEYGNIWQGLTAASTKTETTPVKTKKTKTSVMMKEDVTASRRYSCDDLITSYLNMMTYDSKSLSKSLSRSLSKICCSSGNCCEADFADVNAGAAATRPCRCCSRRTDCSAYVNVTTDILSQNPASFRQNRVESGRASDCRCTSLTGDSRDDAVVVNSRPLLHIKPDGARGSVVAEDCSTNGRIRNSHGFATQSKGGSCLEDPASAKEPSKPLQYVDLRRFDGDTEEGYLYWMKGCKSEAKKRRGAENVQRCQSSSDLDGRGFDRDANSCKSWIDFRAVQQTVEPSQMSSKCQNVSANACSRSSIHGSLKRGAKLSILDETLLSSTPPAPTSPRSKSTAPPSTTSSGPLHEGPTSSGSYAELRLDGSSRTMFSGSEYYNLRLDTIVPLPPKRTEKTHLSLGNFPLAPSAPALVSRKDSFSTETRNTSCLSPRLSLGLMVPPFERRNVEDVDYIPMFSQSPTNDNAIFFTVDLPLKRINNARSTQSQTSDQNLTPRVETMNDFKVPVQTGVTTSSSSSSDGIDPVGYVDMTVKGYSSTTIDRSVVNVEPVQSERPKLQHSRSLEDELVPEIIPFMVNRRTSHDVLQCGRSNEPETSTGNDRRPVTSSDYVSMAGSSRAVHKPSVKPFDNLISHRPFEMTTSSQLEPRNMYFDRSLDSFSSDSALNSLAQSNQMAKLSKGAGMLSRFFRRHSSAKEKTLALDSRTVADDNNGRTGSPKSCLKKIAIVEEVPLHEQQPSEMGETGGGGGSKSSSFEKLGPPPSPPVLNCPPPLVAQDLHTHQYVNLSAAFSGQPPHPVTSLVDSSASDECLPPPLPPKGLVSSKCHDNADVSFRSFISTAGIVGEKTRIIEKPPALTLLSIQEDELELPPLPEKTRVRSSYQSKKMSPDVSPKPPVLPRSIASNATSSSSSFVSTPRVMKPPESPDNSNALLSKHPDCVKSRKPNLTVDTGVSPTSSERRGSRDDPAFKTAPVLRHLSELRTSSMRSRIGSEISNISSMSSGGEENRPSPALTTLRPRYGKEYQRVDRRRLAEDNWSPYTPQQKSPSMTSSFFNFDLQNDVSKAVAFGGCGNSSSGENSPKYPPSLRSRLTSEHTSSSRNGSPIVLDSPRSVSTNVLLNYADIDLLAATSSSSSTGMADPARSNVRTNDGRIEYALIDMIATSALSRAGQKHTRQREGILLERKTEGVANSLKDSKQGISRSLTMTERKAPSEPRRTPSLFNREPK